MMSKEEQRRVLLQQRAGFDRIRELEIEAMKSATFEDRLRSFLQIQQFASKMTQVDRQPDDNVLNDKLNIIRKKYAVTVK